MNTLGLLRISAVESSISQPSINELTHRSDPGFILRPLLDKALLSERPAHLVEILVADSIVVVTVAAFMGVEDFMVVGLEAVLTVVIGKNGTIFKQNER
jgi:hypothetical protein